MINAEDLAAQTSEVESLLEMVYRMSGYDFRDYAQPSLNRRIAKCMTQEQLNTVTALKIKIMYTPETMGTLLDTLTVDFSSMFRDPGFFLALRNRVIPLLREREFIRIWHAGCASGEEVYSMAILLEEEGLYDRTRIYATDVNGGSLEKARRGIYPLSRMKEYTRNYLAAGGLRPFSDYYTAGYHRAMLRPSLGRNVVWSHHNLTRDAKFNDFDLIICRNVLIYFTQKLKDRVQGLFCDSLVPSGILGLGTHETVRFTPFETCYQPLMESERIYIKAHF